MGAKFHCRLSLCLASAACVPAVQPLFLSGNKSFLHQYAPHVSPWQGFCWESGVRLVNQLGDCSKVSFSKFPPAEGTVSERRKFSCLISELPRLVAHDPPRRSRRSRRIL